MSNTKIESSTTKIDEFSAEITAYIIENKSKYKTTFVGYKYEKGVFKADFKALLHNSRGLVSTDILYMHTPTSADEVEGIHDSLSTLFKECHLNSTNLRPLGNVANTHLDFAGKAP